MTRLLHRLAVYLRLRRKRPPLEDMLWAWASASWGKPPPRKK